MSKRGKKKTVLPQSPQVLEKSYTLQDLDRLGQEIEVRKMLEVQKGLSSDDPQAIIKAVNYINSNKGSEQEQLKSFLYNPDVSTLNTNNYRVPTKKVSYETLKRMARTPVIRTVISTRVDQIANFAEPVNNEQEKGWMIRRKPALFDEEEDPTTEEKKQIQYITKFIMEGGTTENKWDFDSFEEYLRMMSWDSLSIDQVCCENVYTRGGKLTQFYPIDGSTIRHLDDSDTERLAEYTSPYKGYWPKYCQVYQEQIYSFYYPWEMTFGVRNKITDINANGYGISELEDMIQVVTWILFGMQYNGNFFSQGSNPKGFFNIKGNVAPNALADFKQMWRNTIAGVANSHKVPVLETGGSTEVDWINMQVNNRDMEFDMWLEFLIVLTCCVFRIDPTECGFNLKKAASVFGQDGQRARLQHSQSKGLTPILKMLQRLITRYWVEPLNDRFEFIFTGVETEDQQIALDMDVKKVMNGMMSMEDGFAKWSNRSFEPETDTILNPVYQQMKQTQQMGGMNMNGMVDNMEQDIEEIDNPFEKSLIGYLNRPEDILVNAEG